MISSRVRKSHKNIVYEPTPPRLSLHVTLPPTVNNIAHFYIKYKKYFSQIVLGYPLVGLVDKCNYV